jgi:hypothetical protein
VNSLVRLKNKFIFLILMFVFGIPGHACPVDTQLILQKIGPRPTPEQKGSDYSDRLWNGHKELASALWEWYRRSSADSAGSFHDSLRDCVQDPLNENDLALAINNEFLQHSLERVQAINPQKFAEINKQRSVAEMTFQIFNACDPSEQEAQDVLGARPGGFNIPTQALFMNISSISVNDWDVIFIHEMGHFLDPIHDHVTAFNDKDTLASIAKIVAAKTEPTALQKAAIDSWLWHGLNIGLLAEWRVWSFTADYVSNRSDYTLGPHTQWLAPFLKQDAKSRRQNIFKFLDLKFTNSSDQIPMINDPLIQSRLELLRAQVREQIARGQTPSSN